MERDVRLRHADKLAHKREHRPDSMADLPAARARGDCLPVDSLRVGNQGDVDKSAQRCVRGELFVDGEVESKLDDGVFGRKLPHVAPGHFGGAALRPQTT